MWDLENNRFKLHRLAGRSEQRITKKTTAGSRASMMRMHSRADSADVSYGVVRPERAARLSVAGQGIRVERDDGNGAALQRLAATDHARGFEPEARDTSKAFRPAIW